MQHCNCARYPQEPRHKIDNQEISYRALYEDDTIKLCRGWIPRSHVAVDRPFQQITFMVNRVTSFTAIDPQNSDKRKVGVALNFVHLFPSAQVDEKGALKHQWPFEESQPWTDAFSFLRKHLRPDERLIAPDAIFENRFGAKCMTIKLRSIKALILSGCCCTKAWSGISFQ
ncbi:MAG: hypothetical protein HC895_16930 [Leptolyngbyaceae cyanobacterium SM1_3_5]|nr:hypothetical protein [Leptolyngbyaceae cyanobacterium SM1_3_5]